MICFIWNISSKLHKENCPVLFPNRTIRFENLFVHVRTWDSERAGSCVKLPSGKAIALLCPLPFVHCKSIVLATNFDVRRRCDLWLMKLLSGKALSQVHCPCKKLWCGFRVRVQWLVETCVKLPSGKAIALFRQIAHLLFFLLRHHLTFNGAISNLPSYLKKYSYQHLCV